MKTMIVCRELTKDRVYFGYNSSSSKKSASNRETFITSYKVIDVIQYTYD